MLGGSVRAFDPAANTVVVEFEGWELVIDILLLPVEISYSVGSLFQFIGELEALSVWEEQGIQ